MRRRRGSSLCLLIVRRTPHMRTRSLIPLALVFAMLMWTTPSGAAQATKEKASAPKAAVAKPAAAKAAPLDINTASKADLTTLSGIGDAYSQKIIAKQAK